MINCRQSAAELVHSSVPSCPMVQSKVGVLGLPVVTALCHSGWVTASTLQTALSENHRLPHVQAKLTSVSLTFSAINTHRVLVSRIKIHKSKAESMK